MAHHILSFIIEPTYQNHFASNYNRMLMIELAWFLPCILFPMYIAVKIVANVLYEVNYHFHLSCIMVYVHSSFPASYGDTTVCIHAFPFSTFPFPFPRHIPCLEKLSLKLRFHIRSKQYVNAKKHSINKCL